MIRGLYSLLMSAIVVLAGILAGCWGYPDGFLPPPTATPSAPGDSARVVQIIDGDTVEIEMAGKPYRLRYIGIDTPERNTPYYEEASRANAELVAGRTVRLEKDVSETDRYGRLLRYVYVGDLMVNAELVRQGYATAAMFPPDVKYQEYFRALQKEAQEAGRGLWSRPAESSAAQQTGMVLISDIFYDGQVSGTESDEYAEIANLGDAPANLGGWRLNAGAPGQDFVFPAFVLQPGQSCRVYTNEDHPDSCGFRFGSPDPLWSNKKDCGRLYNDAGEQVAEYCY